MGAKFIVDRRCDVKQGMTLTGLIKGLQYQGLLREMGELAAAGNLADCDAEARVEILLPTFEAIPADLTIRELQEQTAALLEHRLACRSCPSSLRGHVGGCIGYLPYPISEGMEFLLWQTAVRGLKGELPKMWLTRVLAFVERAQGLRKTPFSDEMRQRRDLLGPRPRLHASGPFWGRIRISSSQVLDLFFKPGVIAGEELRELAGFLEAALALARAIEPALRDEEKRLSMIDDLQPYSAVHELLTRALKQGIGVYVWP